MNEPKDKLIEITKRTAHARLPDGFRGGLVDACLSESRELKIVAHYFPSTPGHRLVASGATADSTGEDAAWAARRLMAVEDPAPRAPDVHWFTNVLDIAGRFTSSIFAPSTTQVGDKIYLRGFVLNVVAIHSDDELELEVVS